MPCGELVNPGRGLYDRAKTMIPGGTQLLSKRPEMFAPGRWPPYYRSAHGCQVVDLDGRSYIDMSLMGVGSCLLGYADEDVTEAVTRRIRDGSMCTLNNPEEVELAELLLEMHPWAGAVRYCRTGGEAMAIAVRIARASTRREVIAFCGYHGWHDWYLAANRVAGAAEADNLRDHLLPGLSCAGVPPQLAGTTLPFRYNHPEELEAILKAHRGRVAAVVMEPTRSTEPDHGFLERIRDLCDHGGAALIFDEITVGFRLHFGGAHLRYRVTPDIAVFAKALGNGHPMAAVIGVDAVMQAAQESFISSTAWTEGVGPVAAIATLRKLKSLDAPAHVASIGMRWRQGLERLGRQFAVPLKFSGPAALCSIYIDDPDRLALQTLLTVRMLDRGFLAGAAFYPSCAHRSEQVDAYLAAMESVLPEINEAIARKDAVSRVGAVKHSGFARLA